MTATTIVPANADGTYDEPTWGEGGGPFTVPAFESPGVTDGTALAANEINYEWQHLARWIRAMAIGRSVPSDRGLFSSFLFPGSGTWTTGGATLNSSLAASWAMIDASDDGGVVVQFNVPVGAPHAFTASRDTYVNLNEAGAVEYQAVANGAAAPVPTAGYVAVWKVVTDGTEITAATVLVRDRPTFKDILVETLGVLVDMAIIGGVEIGGTLDVTGATDLSSTLDVAGDATFALNVEIGGDLDMVGNNIVNGGLVSSATLATTGNASIGGNLDMTSGSITNVTTFGASGDSTFGAGVAVTGGVSIGGNLDMTSGAISNVTTIGSSGLASLGSVSTASATVTSLTCGLASFAGTVDASAVVVRMLEADFSATTLTLDAGELRWDGTKLAVGDGFNPKPIAMFYEVFVAGPIAGAIGAGSTVTGTTITVPLTIGDIVWVEGGFDTANASASVVSSGLNVSIGGVPTVLVDSDRDATTNNVPVSVTVRYRYTASVTDDHSFFLTHGGGAGNTSTTNAGLTVRRTA